MFTFLLLSTICEKILAWEPSVNPYLMIPRVISLGSAMQMRNIMAYNSHTASKFFPITGGQDL